jgi:hypothetical protein
VGDEEEPEPGPGRQTSKRTAWTRAWRRSQPRISSAACASATVRSAA